MAPDEHNLRVLGICEGIQGVWRASFPVAYKPALRLIGQDKIVFK